MNKEAIGRSIKETLAKPKKFIKENPVESVACVFAESAILFGSIDLVKGHYVVSSVPIVVGLSLNVLIARNIIAKNNMKKIRSALEDTNVVLKSK